LKDDDIKKHSTLHMEPMSLQVHNLGKTSFKKMFITKRSKQIHAIKEERKF